MHQKNRNASDSCDSDDMRLGSSGTDLDACFWTFSYIVRIRDRKNPRFLQLLGHMRTRLKVDDQDVVDNAEVAQSMNNFFCSVGEKLSDAIPQQPNPLLSYEYVVN